MGSNGDCFIGDQRVECPSAPNNSSTSTEEKMDILPLYKPLDKRNDLLFSVIFLSIILCIALLGIFKTKIFGKTLGEYIKPIWYFILVALAVVAWQYLVGVNLNAGNIQLRISQWIWELAVLVSAYKLSKVSGFSYGNMFVLAILYSLFIHGLKVSIRYFFYGKTLLYSLDRFVYGSMLVMVFSFLLGSVFVYLKNRSIGKPT